MFDTNSNLRGLGEPPSFIDKFARFAANLLSTGGIVKKVVVGIAALILLKLIWSFWPISSVQSGYNGVITTMGGIDRVAEEGPTWVSPWQKIDMMNMRAQAVEIKQADGGTKDQQPVAVSMTVRFQIVPDRVAHVYKQHSKSGDLSGPVSTATEEVFKAVTARYTAPELIDKRAQVSNEILSGLNAKLALYGAKALNVDMTRFAFSAAYMSAIEAKVTQEQLRLGAENKLLTVEAEEKQKLVVAEAEAAATRATADGKAYAQLTVAKAEAESIKVQAQALAQNSNVLELRRIEVEQTRANRWNGALPTSVYGSAPIPFLNSK